MFTYFYTNISYRFWKSGFLLDFYFKRFTYTVLWVILFYFNILFSEKYFIEHNFLKIILYLDYYKGLLNVYSQYFSFYQVGVIWFISFIIIILSLNV